MVAVDYPRMSTHRLEICAKVATALDEMRGKLNGSPIGRLDFSYGIDRASFNVRDRIARGAARAEIEEAAITLASIIFYYIETGDSK